LQRDGAARRFPDSKAALSAKAPLDVEEVLYFAVFGMRVLE